MAYGNPLNVAQERAFRKLAAIGRVADQRQIPIYPTVADRLESKGYITIGIAFGPRGGKYRTYRITDFGLRWLKDNPEPMSHLWTADCGYVAGCMFHYRAFCEQSKWRVGFSYRSHDVLTKTEQGIAQIMVSERLPGNKPAAVVSWDWSQAGTRIEPREVDKHATYWFGRRVSHAEYGGGAIVNHQSQKIVVDGSEEQSNTIWVLFDESVGHMAWYGEMGRSVIFYAHPPELKLLLTEDKALTAEVRWKEHPIPANSTYSQVMREVARGVR